MRIAARASSNKHTGSSLTLVVDGLRMARERAVDGSRQSLERHLEARAVLYKKHASSASTLSLPPRMSAHILAARVTLDEPEASTGATQRPLSRMSFQFQGTSLAFGKTRHSCWPKSNACNRAREQSRLLTRFSIQRQFLARGALVFALKPEAALEQPNPAPPKTGTRANKTATSSDAAPAAPVAPLRTALLRRARIASLSLIPRLLLQREKAPNKPHHPWQSYADDPVLMALHQRRAHGSRPGQRHDPYRIGLVIEGGGMRGSIAAGMCAALGYLGFADAFDVIFGSSAGAICGAYVVARQLPGYGPSVYFEDIANDRFINKRALWQPLRSSSRTRPVLDLDFLLDEVMVHIKPLDWNKFAQNNAVQPLRPVASSLTHARSVAFDGFRTYAELRECLRASARVPGIAGPLVPIGDDIYADGILFEAIPFRSALADGCTHLLALRTRPVGTRVPRIAGFYERMIAAPELEAFPHVRDYIVRGGHFKQYLEDIRILEDRKSARHVHVRSILKERWCSALPEQASILAIAPPRGDPEISQLETRPEVIFEATRYGFGLAYEMLVAPYQRPAGDGARFAARVFSDEKLDEILRARETALKYRRSVRRNALALSRLRRISFLQRFQKSSRSDPFLIPSNPHFTTDAYLSSLKTARQAPERSSVQEPAADPATSRSDQRIAPALAGDAATSAGALDRLHQPNVTELAADNEARHRRGFLFLPRFAGLRLVQRQSR